MNYFGYFVAQNLNDIGSSLGWDAATGKRLKLRASEQLMKDTGSFETGSAGVQLLTAPPSCSLDGRAEAGRYVKIISGREFPPVGTMNGYFQVVGRGVDCDLRDYVRVQFENGKQGWILASTLHEKESGIKRATNSVTLRCSKSEAKACIDKLNTLMGGSNGIKEAAPSAENLISLNLVTTDGKPLAKSYNDSNVATCQESGYYRSSSVSTPATAELLERVSAKTRDVQAKIVQNLGLTGWEDPANPIGNYDFFRASELEDCKSNLKSCTIQIDSRSYGGPRISGLEELLKLDTGKLDTRDLLVFIKSRRFNISTSSDNKLDYAAFSYQRRTLGQDALKHCQSILDETKTTSNLTSAVELLNSIDPKQFESHADYNAKSWMDKLKNFGQKCRALKALMSGADAKEFDDVELDVSDGTNSAAMKVRTIKKIEPGKASLMDGLKKEIKAFEDELMGYIGSPDGQSACKYDPFATTSLVQKLAGEPCVDQIYVPDRFIPIALRDSDTSKIVLDESDEKHFGVRLSGCAQERGFFDWGSSNPEISK